MTQHKIDFESLNNYFKMLKCTMSENNKIRVECSSKLVYNHDRNRINIQNSATADSIYLKL